MTPKKWLAIFAAFLLGFLAVLALCNVIIDPFGVFGDRFLQWYEYDMTQNPRVAKIAYLDQNYENYNAYVVGSSKASSLSVEQLNDYTGDSWYNMTWYGGDLKDEAELVSYIIENYQVDQIILTVDPESADLYNTGSQTNLKTCMHAKVCGESQLLFYGRYLFCNLSYSYEKIINYLQSGILPVNSNVYVAETGCYNKSIRDTSNIGDMTSYLAYEGMATSISARTMRYIDEAIDCISYIKNLCEENDITFTLVGVPVSDVEFNSYPQEQIAEFWTRLAEITDFYTFWGSNTINSDLRYFYDAKHFRNCVGDMVLATLFGNDSVWMPEDFGILTTSDNVADLVEGAYTSDDEPDSYTAVVPILMYHSFTENEDAVSSTTILVSDFEEQLLALAEAGYQSITYDQLIDYVYNGTDLPDNPILITIDDGYQNNLDLAAPLLEAYGFSANIAVIGVSIGHTCYKDTDSAITPHFELEDALEWVSKGVLTISTHSYDMHQVTSLDGTDCRKGVLQMDGETEAEYIFALTYDYLTAIGQLSAVLEDIPSVFTYPEGRYSTLSEVVLKGLGVKVTVTINSGVNQVVKGIPQSLYALKRINVAGGTDADTLLTTLENLISAIVDD